MWLLPIKEQKNILTAFFKHYKELGVEYIRMDFLSWYEDGFDRGMEANWGNGLVGRGYGRECYEKALSISVFRPLAMVFLLHWLCHILKIMPSWKGNMVIWCVL